MRQPPDCAALSPRLVSWLLWGSLFLGGLLLRSQAQIPPTVRPDNTVGTVVTQQGNRYDITGGTQRGPNLFHSFARFSVGKDTTANFTSEQTGIKNVLSRVTGGHRSDIDGQLRTDGQLRAEGANLYLLNPSGVVFGPNATLDVSGSFHVSTADYLRLADGAKFSAHLSENSTFSVAPPAAFGFLGSAPAAITVQGSSLQVPAGQTLAVAGGDVQITGGLLQAESGRIQIASVASPGEVMPNPLGQVPDLQVDSFTNLGRIDLQDTIMTVSSSTGAGTVLIRGGRLMADRLSLLADTPGTGESARLGLDLRVTGDAIFTTTAMSAGSSGAGAAGEVRITAGSLQLKENTFVGSNALGTADGGNVTIKAGRLDVLDRSSVNANTSGSGKGGNLDVMAEQVLLSGTHATACCTGLFAAQLAQSGTGNAGNLRVTASSLHILDGAGISTSTSGPGQAGNIAVTAERVALSKSSGPNVSTGIFANTSSSGRGGNLQLTAESIAITNRASVQASTFGSGDAGNITVTTNSLELREASFIGASGLFSAGGHAGTVNVTAGRVFIAGRADSQDPFGTDFTGISTAAGVAGGNAGNLRLTAESLVLTQRGSVSTVSFGSGRGGNLDVQAGSVQVVDGSTILASALGPGPGGNVTVKAGSVVVRGVNSGPFVSSTTGTATLSRSAIGSQAGVRGGSAGAVQVTANRVEVLDGGSLASNTFGVGNSGHIDVMADSLVLVGVNTGFRDFLAMRGVPLDAASGLASAGILTDSNSSFLGDRTTGSGGDVRVQAGTLHLQDGGTISARTTGPGMGGTIALQADRVTLASGASISAESAVSANPGTTKAGKAGNIAITTSGTFHSDNGRVTTAADQAEGGTITISAGQIQLRNGARVSAETTGRGNAGDITLVTQAPLTLTQGHIVARATQADGGNLRLMTPMLVRLRDSTITTEVGGGAQTVGGSITIDAQFVLLQNSRIVANAFAGHGGNIHIQAQQAFLADPSSTVSASSVLGINGQVAIQAPVTSLSESLTLLPQAFASVTEWLHDRCAARLREGTVNSFVVHGQASPPPTYDGPLPSRLYTPPGSLLPPTMDGQTLQPPTPSSPSPARRTAVSVPLRLDRPCP